MLYVGEYKYASLRYCSLLGRNVVFENYYGDDVKKPGKCLYESICGCEICSYLNDPAINMLPSGGNVEELQVRVAE